MIWTEPDGDQPLLLLLGCSTLAGVIGSRPKTRAEHQHQDAVRCKRSPCKDAWGDRWTTNQPMRLMFRKDDSFSER